MPRPIFPAYPLTISQACRITELPREILQAAIDSGALPTRTFLEKVKKITPQDLADWYNANAVASSDIACETGRQS